MSSKWASTSLGSNWMVARSPGTAAAPQELVGRGAHREDAVVREPVKAERPGPQQREVPPSW
jgi:hypothetical protein